jgi:hypothetical protein
VPVADIEGAFKEGIKHIGEHDGLICAGSLYLIGKLRTLIRKYLETL